MKMYFTKYCIVQTFVFSGFLNNIYAMTDRSNKSSTRADRQLRPVLSGIAFLLAANLVAKGVLASSQQLTSYPNNIQGSLYISLNNPVTHQPALSHQLSISTPNNDISTQNSKPITQQQIFNIHDLIMPDNDQEYSVEESFRKFQIKKNENNDLYLPLSTNNEEVQFSVKVNEQNNTSINEKNDDEVELLYDNTENSTDSLIEIAKQINMTTKTTTTIKTTTTSLPLVTTTQDMRNTEIALNNNTSNNTGNYGPSNGYEYFSITYGPPGFVNGTSTNTTNTTTSNNTYSYNNYGPSNGNEHISFTYGPPVYQKPFFSSPEDPYLNNFNQYYNNYYENNPLYYSYLYKYHDYFNKYYNKYDYNNYHGYLNNYLGK